MKKNIIKALDLLPPKVNNEKVKLISASENLENTILSASLFSYGYDFKQISEKVNSFSKSEKQEYFKQIFQDCNSYDLMPKFF